MYNHFDLVCRHIFICYKKFCTPFQHKILYWDYRNDPQFSDGYAWANSADPDQTAPRGAV